MSNGTSSSSSSSTGSYHAHGMPVPPSGTGPHYTDDITYTRPFHPSPFELLFLVNTRGHNNALQNASMGQPHLQFAIDSLIRLRAQRASLNAIIEETNVYAANLTFNATVPSPQTFVTQIQMIQHSYEQQRRTEQGLGQLWSLPSIRTNFVSVVLEQSLFYLGRLVPPPWSPSLSPPPLLIPPPGLPIPQQPPVMIPPQSMPSPSVSLQHLPLPPPKPKPLPEPISAPTTFNPFDVDNEPLAPPLSVPFLASGKFNPTFISIRDAVRANPGVQINTRAFTNPPAPYNYLNNISFSMG
ncbi:hypothetical protein Moror_11566 [Moniliophthora roreri MCA 2997]|uniref:Uncharacterized protein n=1 Tax=Moniliophthora roreri (strain MCA 2997) TaxID=1381753 RepID=V2WJH1_MONRO|nr:hypothetical protein Moror_11566 [Moniliophthora roreri MCA 2997]